MQATPTEYAGTVFKSKCEAIFARNLDLAHVLWEYEPLRLKVDDWVPDFFVCRKSYRLKTLGFGIIEFKPSEPTPTYKNLLLQRFLSSKLEKYDCNLVIGNPFDISIPRTMETADSSGWIKSDVPPDRHFCFAYWNHALTYRFDLA